MTIERGYRGQEPVVGPPSPQACCGRHLIRANNKPYSRLAALRIIADRLSKNVSLKPRPLDSKVVEAPPKNFSTSVPRPRSRTAANWRNLPPGHDRNSLVALDVVDERWRFRHAYVRCDAWRKAPLGCSGGDWRYLLSCKEAPEEEPRAWRWPFERTSRLGWRSCRCWRLAAPTGRAS
jgi:hypothetical protein